MNASGTWPERQNLSDIHKDQAETSVAVRADWRELVKAGLASPRSVGTPAEIGGANGVDPTTAAELARAVQP